MVTTVHGGGSEILVDFKKVPVAVFKIFVSFPYSQQQLRVPDFNHAQVLVVDLAKSRAVCTVDLDNDVQPKKKFTPFTYFLSAVAVPSHYTLPR
jgi:hypothetical protein